jgi:hypothetical protein
MYILIVGIVLTLMSSKYCRYLLNSTYYSLLERVILD